MAKIIHNKKHAIDSSTDHTSTATEDNLISADANGLPKDSTIPSSYVDQDVSSGSSPTIESTNIGFLNTETVKQVLIDTINIGILDKGIVTDDGGLNISWNDGYEIYEDGTPSVIEIDAGSGTCTDNAVNYLVWTTGTAFTLGTTPADILSGEIVVARISCQAGDIEELHISPSINERAAGVIDALVHLIPVVVDSGLIIQEDTDVTNALDVKSTAGSYYLNGHARVDRGEILSRTTPLIRHFKTAGAWTTDTNAEIDPTQYNDGTNLVATTASKYYKSLFIIDGGVIHWVYGTVEYNNVGDAVDGPLPTIPPGLSKLVNSTSLVMKGDATTLPSAGSVQWIDERPFLTTAGVSGAITAHSNLIELTYDESGHTGFARDTDLTDHTGDTSDPHSTIPFLGIATYEPTGFPNTTDSTMSFTDGTRTFSISPAVSTFDFYTRGVKFTKSSTENYVISDVDGLHYIYYNSSGVLTESVNPSSDTLEELIEQECFCMSVYWNVAHVLSHHVGEERHGIQMDGATHARLHFADGAIFVEGLALGDINADASGNLNSSAQLSASTGFFEDEDLFFTVPAKTVPAQINVIYREGANGIWTEDTATDYPVKRFGSSRLAYNQFTGGTWTQTEVGNNNFMLMHIAVTNNITPADRWVAIQGQNVYLNISDAQTGAQTELNTLAFGGLPSPELLFIGTVIFQTSNSYTNAVKARIRSTEDGGDYVDWRTSRGTGAVGGGGINSLLEDTSPQLGGNLDANGFLITGLDASTTAQGVVELATTAETETGTDTARAVTPDGLAGSRYGQKTITFKVIANDASLTVGDGLGTFTIPDIVDGMNLVNAAAHVFTASSSGLPTIQLYNVTQAADMLSTKITIDVSEKDSSTATTPPVIDTANDDVVEGNEIRVDCDIAGTGTLGLEIRCTFETP